MRVLMTGAAGFIGSSVAQALAARGDEVVGVDNFNDFYDPARKEANVREVEVVAAGRFRVVRGDLLEESVIRPLLERDDTRPDVFVHLAAYAGVRPSIQRPLIYQKVNVEGTTKLLEWARQAGIKPFVFASSSSVYGARDHGPFSETDSVDDPISPYAATKKMGELIGYTYHHLHGTHFHALRFFTVYGPRQRPEMAIHLFARNILEGRPIRMHGDGTSSRDYTYIDDIVRGVLGSIDRARVTPEYRIYNLGGSETTSLRRLVEVVQEAVGRRADIEVHPAQPGDVPMTFANVERAGHELGYRPQVRIEDGVARFVEWLETVTSGSPR